MWIVYHLCSCDSGDGDIRSEVRGGVNKIISSSKPTSIAKSCPHLSSSPHLLMALPEVDSMENIEGNITSYLVWLYFSVSVCWMMVRDDGSKLLSSPFFLLFLTPPGPHPSTLLRFHQFITIAFIKWMDMKIASLFERVVQLPNSYLVFIFDFSFLLIFFFLHSLERHRQTPSRRVTINFHE